MNTRFEAAWEMHNFLTAHKIPYAIIGGTAVALWGEPRFTRDIDLVAMTSAEEGVDSLVRLVLSQFSSRISDPLSLARQARMVVIRTSNGCDVDISLGAPGYEDEVIRRAVNYELEPGKSVRVCSAEDLIIHKCLAGRPQDLTDVEGIIIRQQDTLDIEYIIKWLAFLANLTDSQVQERFEKAWRSVRHTAPPKEHKSAKRTKRKQ